MTMLIAKTVIYRTVKPGKPGDVSKGLKPVPPEQEEVLPGELFDARNADEYAELINLGAAVPAPKDADKDSSRKSKTAAKPSAAKKAKADADADKATTAPTAPTGKKSETTPAGKTTEGGDGSEMV